METNQKLDPEFKAKLLAALRSGEYKQGRGSLYNSLDNSYCCLGISGLMCGVAKTSMANRSYFSLINNDGYQAPPNNYPTIFLRTDFADQTYAFRLAKMNDDGKTFAEIADYIEKEL